MTRVACELNSRAMLSKRALYITINDIAANGDGIVKKINAQISAMEEKGFEVDVAYLDKSFAYVVERGSGRRSAEARRGHLGLLQLIKLLKNCSRTYDVGYIRNPHGGIHPIFLPRLLQCIRARCRKLILEVPHYPYDDEASTFKVRISTICHKVIRSALPRYLDLIVYTGMHVKTIWGVSSRRIFNCPPDNLPMSRSGRDYSGSVKFVGVATLAYWHGYDRLIRGISDYYKRGGRADVAFHVVGDTEPTYSVLKSLVRELSIEDKVVFHGRLEGDELDAVFDECNVGVDSLGRHRSGSSYNDSIKSKEYCWRGVPFIRSHGDDSISGCDFVFDVKPTEDPVDVAEIIRWLNRQNIPAERIRDFAAQRFRWVQQFEGIF